MNFNDRYEFCKGLSIIRVCEDIGGVQFRGSKRNTSSPLRTSSSKNAFSVHEGTNTFTDWGYPVDDNARGVASGDPIDFVRYYYSCSFKEAIDILWKRYHGGDVNADHKATYVEKKRHEAPNLTKEQLDGAYATFLSLAKLDKKALEYLHNRGLTDDEIRHFNFRSFPKQFIKAELNQELRNLGIEPASVPGLYLKQGCSDASFKYYDALILPVRTVEGYIAGLQMRFYEVDDGPRYVWFSSERYSTPNFQYDGKSPGTPIGFVDYSVRNSSTLFITEGMFKAIAINRCYGCPVLTVQGVGVLNGIEDAVKAARKKYPGISRILIAYDADFISNVNVTLQAIRLYNMLRTSVGDVRCQYVFWDEAYGKGFDDLILNTGGWNVNGIVRTIDMDIFENVVTSILTDLKKLWVEGDRTAIAALLREHLLLHC